MWERDSYRDNVLIQFFFLSINTDSLEEYYRLNFVLMNDHGYSLSELENMIPWERQVYTNLLIESLKKKKEDMMFKKEAEKFR